ncbi:MAG: MarP family serine protease [Acidimicrobiia bacterium]
MNTLDLVVLVLILGAGVGGWRLGFVARVVAWAGVVVGLGIGVRFVPRVVTTFGGSKPANRASVAVLFLVLVALLGQTVGLAVGGLVHRIVPMRKRLPRWDRLAGAIVGVVGVLALLWMVIPSLATAKGWPARMARGSTIVAAIERWAPSQPARFAAWGRAISDAPYPSALGTLQSPPNPGPPPGTSITTTVDMRVRASTVLVTGRACNEIQEGSGWIAAPDLVVTNAHVVAGERATTVEDASGSAMAATVIAFDPVRDVAILDVPALTTSDPAARPLVMADGVVGGVGAVYGHPGGGALRASPARVGDEIVAVGTDIYRTGTSRRHVYVLAAALAPGDSGGALVNRRGELIGMAFAIDPGRSATAYALTDAEIRPVISQVLERDPAAVATGRCLVS